MKPGNKHSDQSDEELIDRFRATGDNHYLGVVLERYTALLLGIGLKYLKDKEPALDAVQQVFLKILTHFPAEEIKNFKGWLYVLMRNHCLQALRDKHLFADESVLARVPETPAEEEPVTYTTEQLNEAVVKLGREQKQCITLFYLQKLSYQQITDQTGFSFTQVKSYIQNGKRNLKIILKQATPGWHE